MTLPLAYAWLSAEPGPRMLTEALRLYGTVETPGRQDNPIILAWAKEVGLENYTHDETPWCGLLMAVVAKRAGKPVPEKPLWALNWARWGEPSRPELGAVLAFRRPGGGHVGEYCGEDADAYHVLGGNTRNAVSIARIAKTRLVACRAIYAVGRPANVRPVWLTASGELSTDEA